MGVGDLTAIQPLLGAVLMLCVSLVQGARTTLGMIFNRSLRDWHTVTAREVLPQARSGEQSQESNTPTESFSALCRESRFPVSWGSTPSPRGVPTEILGSRFACPRMTPWGWWDS